MARPARIARRAGANLSRVARQLVARSVLPSAEGFWVVVRLGADLEDIALPRLPFARNESQSLLEVLDTLEAAAADPDVDGVLLRFAGSPSGWSRIHSLRRAVEQLRERGVAVAAYADSFDAASLLVASAADRIFLPESGDVMLVGLRAESLYVRGLLERLEVRPEVVRIGQYKSAAESISRDSMSPEEREQRTALLDDLFDELVEGIASGRGLSVDAVRDRIDAGPYHARAAVAAGLVDDCCYPDELEGKLEALCPEPPESRPGPRRVHLVDGRVYHALRAADPGFRPLLDGLPRIAYVVARGAIHRGGDPRGIASDRFRGLLDGLGRDEEVRGVVLRVDSPGGDSTASDLLWRSVSLLTREKPVVVSMGDVAASGGYYVAAAADAVFAEKGTVTGSIGVVGGKLNLEGLMRRVGVTSEGIERGARAGMLSASRGFTSDERAAVRAEMESVYELFVERVATGRGLSPEAIDRAAHGRVFSGLRARSLGLVDAIGGPLESLREARRLAGLRDDERFLVDLHPRAGGLPRLRSLLRWLPGNAGRF